MGQIVLLRHVRSFLFFHHLGPCPRHPEIAYAGFIEGKELVDTRMHVGANWRHDHPEKQPAKLEFAF